MKRQSRPFVVQHIRHRGREHDRNPQPSFRGAYSGFMMDTRPTSRAEPTPPTIDAMDIRPKPNTVLPDLTYVDPLQSLQDEARPAQTRRRRMARAVPIQVAPIPEPKIITEEPVTIEVVPRIEQGKRLVSRRLYNRWAHYKSAVAALRSSNSGRDIECLRPEEKWKSRVSVYAW